MDRERFPFQGKRTATDGIVKVFAENTSRAISEVWRFSTKPRSGSDLDNPEKSVAVSLPTEKGTSP